MKHLDEQQIRSRIDPELGFARAVVDGGGLSLPRDLPRLRAMSSQLLDQLIDASGPFDGEIRELTVPGLGANPAVSALLYQPSQPLFDDAMMIWVHGGGFVSGQANDPNVFRFTPVLPVLSVDYRMAPEHRSPAAVHDAAAALLWVADMAESLGIDPGRIVLAGASAGGGLALGTALYNRDELGVPVHYQTLTYPMLDYRHSTRSGQYPLPNTTWTRQVSLQAWSLYVDAGPPSPYTSPARAEDLSGLPATYLMTGEIDLFRDEIVDFADRLHDLGGAVELALYPGAVHAFDMLAPDAAVSRRAIAHQVAALIHALSVSEGA